MVFHVNKDKRRAYIDLIEQLSLLHDPQNPQEFNSFLKKIEQEVKDKLLCETEYLSYLTFALSRSVKFVSDIDQNMDNTLKNYLGQTGIPAWREMIKLIQVKQSWVKTIKNLREKNEKNVITAILLCYALKLHTQIEAYPDEVLSGDFYLKIEKIERKTGKPIPGTIIEDQLLEAEVL